MELTENLGLKKPAQTDFYNVDDFNENFEKIDTKMKELEENAGVDITPESIGAMPLKGKSSTISTYPEKEGFYRVASGTLFQNMTPDSPYGLLIMFGAVYKLHMFISSQGSLYWGYTDNYTEPSKWHEAGDASEFLQLDGGTLTGDLKVEKSFPRLELKDSKSARSLDFLAIDDYVEIVNRLDDTDSRGIRIKPETEDVKTSVFIDEYVNGLHKSYQLFGEHNRSSMYTISQTDITAGTTQLEDGKLYIVYE
jgi:hypothetical protein